MKKYYAILIGCVALFVLSASIVVTASTIQASTNVTLQSVASLEKETLSFKCEITNFNNTNSQKKDIEPENSDTIPFKNLEQSEKQTPPPQDRQNKYILFGFSFEIDDLILIGLIILLFLESDKNYALIIILGLILLNVNLGDILKLF